MPADAHLHETTFNSGNTADLPPVDHSSAQSKESIVGDPSSVPTETYKVEPTVGPEPSTVASNENSSESQPTSPKNEPEKKPVPVERHQTPEILPETVSTLTDVFKREYKALLKVEEQGGELSRWQQNFLQDIRNRFLAENRVDISQAKPEQIEMLCGELLKNEIFQLQMVKIAERQQEALQVATGASFEWRPDVMIKDWQFHKLEVNRKVAFKRSTFDSNRTFRNHNGEVVELDAAQKQYLMMLEDVRTTLNNTELTGRGKQQVTDVMEKIMSARVNFYKHIGDRDLTDYEHLNIVKVRSNTLMYPAITPLTKGSAQSIPESSFLEANALNSQAFGITEVSRISLGGGKEGLNKQLEAITGRIQQETGKKVQEVIGSKREELARTRIEEVLHDLKTGEAITESSDSSNEQIKAIREVQLPELEKNLEAAKKRDQFIDDIEAKKAQLKELTFQLEPHRSAIDTFSKAQENYRTAAHELQLAEHTRQDYIEQMNSLREGIQNFSAPSGKGNQVRVDQSSQGKIADELINVNRSIGELGITQKREILTQRQAEIEKARQALPDEIVELIKQERELIQQKEALERSQLYLEQNTPSLKKSDNWQTAEEVMQSQEDLKKELERHLTNSPKERKVRLYETLEEVMRLENWEQFEKRLREKPNTALAEFMLDEAQKIYPENSRAYLWAMRQLGGEEVLFNQPQSREKFQQFSNLIPPEVFVEALKRQYPEDDFKSILETKVTAKFMKNLMNEVIEKGTSGKLGEQQEQATQSSPENTAEKVEPEVNQNDSGEIENLRDKYRTEKEARATEAHIEISIHDLEDRISKQKIMGELTIDSNTLREVTTGLSSGNTEEVLANLATLLPSARPEELNTLVNLAQETKTSATQVTEIFAESLSKNFENEQQISLATLALFANNEVREQILKEVREGMSYEEIVGQLPNEVKAVTAGIKKTLEGLTGTNAPSDIVRKIMLVVQAQRNQAEAKMLGNFIIAAQIEANFNKSQERN